MGLEGPTSTYSFLIIIFVFVLGLVFVLGFVFFVFVGLLFWVLLRQTHQTNKQTNKQEENKIKMCVPCVWGILGGEVWQKKSPQIIKQ